MSNNGLKAFVSGAALGAGVALLFAPRSGEDTREQLRSLGEEASNTVQEGSQDLSERISSLRQDIERLTSDTLNSGQERVQDEIEALSKALKEGKNVLQEERAERSNASNEGETTTAGEAE